jgi:hypothetical protein
MRIILARTALILLFVAACLLSWGVRSYGTPFRTLNGGITYGQCGIEVWGEPGHFCGDY